jgi:hypothetical protein
MGPPAKSIRLVLVLFSFRFCLNFCSYLFIIFNPLSLCSLLVGRIFEALNFFWSLFPSQTQTQHAQHRFGKRLGHHEDPDRSGRLQEPKQEERLEERRASIDFDQFPFGYSDGLWRCRLGRSRCLFFPFLSFSASSVLLCCWVATFQFFFLLLLPFFSPSSPFFSPSSPAH